MSCIHLCHGVPLYFVFIFTRARSCVEFRYIKIGDKEVEYHASFRLILHTKLANPHYKPEMQAQASLINFTVTRDGLEDQLLAEVVATERPDLEEQKVPYLCVLVCIYVCTYVFVCTAVFPLKIRLPKVLTPIVEVSKYP